MNDLMIPDKAAIPSYILDPTLAKQANDEAAAGISTGMPPRVKLSMKQFKLVDAAGEETLFPPSKMIIGPDENSYLPVVVLRAKKPLQKAWYATAYNPNEDGKQPDCFSTDSERPDPTSLAVQSDLCATCPHNQFGSAVDQSGNAMKGKACADSKILAVFVPGSRKVETDPKVYQFKLPPASLKNFGMYVKQLSSAGIPLGTAQTLVGFDQTKDNPVLIFKFGGFLPEASLPKLAEMAALPETEDIIGGFNAPALPAPPVTQRLDVPDPAADVFNNDKMKAAQAAEAAQKAEAEAAAKSRSEKAAATKAANKKAKEEAEAKAKADAEAAAAAQGGGELLDDLGLDLGSVPAAVTAPAAAAASSGEVTDDQLMKDLGL